MRLFFYSLTLFSLSSFFAQETATITKIGFGEVHTIQSNILKEERKLNIYIPIDFNKDSSYNIIYLLDGSLSEDFYHITGLVQFFRLMFTMPNTLVVGIENVDRKRDFTFPTSDAQLKKDVPTSGGSKLFIEFIEKELQPYIQTSFNTTSTKIIIGQSLGGLLATEILLKKRDLFSHYLITSPSLWWDNQSLFETSIFKLNNSFTSTFVHISVGKEHKIMIKDAKKLYRFLKKSKSAGIKSIFNYLPKEDHATILHNSVYNSFRILYPKIIW